MTESMPKVGHTMSNLERMISKFLFCPNQSNQINNTSTTELHAKFVFVKP